MIYIEELTTIIVNALRVENSNPYECPPFEYGEADTLEESVYNALCVAQFDLLFKHLNGCWTECIPGYELQQRPLTFRAMTRLLHLISNECLVDCAYTRSPLSLVDWDMVEERFI